jgi:ABC-type phosphate transport system substrate-binding protein
MKRHLSILLLFALSSVAPCLAHHMAVVVNKDNKLEDVSSAHLARIFRAETRKWPDGGDVVLVFHTNFSGERTTLERLMKISDNELQSLIAAHKASIKMAASDSEVLSLVESNPGAIGLVEVNSINGSIKVVKVDGKLPTEAGYLPH